MMYTSATERYYIWRIDEKLDVIYDIRADTLYTRAGLDLKDETADPTDYYNLIRTIWTCKEILHYKSSSEI
jgi:hypothetical protein